jgi:hypothetical protein
MATMTLRRAQARHLNEPVVVSAKRFGFFPQVFVWRGQRHDVRAVEACRTEVRHNWRGQVERHRFQVRTASAVFELTHDPARDTWKVEKMWSG